MTTREMLLTVKDALILTTKYLRDHGSPSPRLDAEVLIAHALGIRRIDLYLSPERPVLESERAILRESVRRRGRGEPVAYITGRREFYGIVFEVTRDVFIPRPETEVLVDAVLDALRGLERPSVVDVGTGSGAIACSVAARHPSAVVLATDVSFKALEIARANVTRNGLSHRVFLAQMDVLEGMVAQPCADVIVSNPPYVSKADPIEPAVREYEPATALYCADDGREVSARLMAQAPARLKPGGSLVIEVGAIPHREWVRAYLERAADWRDVRPLRDAAGEVRGFCAVRSV